MKKYNIRAGKLSGFWTVGLGMFLLTSCQDFLPGEFQEEEFSLGPLDSQARAILLADSLAVPISASTSDSLDSLVSDSVWIDSVEVNWRITLPGDTGYVALNLVEGPALILFFDDIVSVYVQDGNGTEIEAASDVFPLETFAYAPEIKSRIEYNLSGGEHYLIRFVASASSFHTVILEDQ